MKILVVDDEKVIVKGIKFNLENDGYEVDTAYDGEEAMVLLCENKYDAVLLDLMLPKIDGLEICRRVREFSNVPIIMLTAKTDDNDKLIGFEYGADDYVTKPFNILELKARIRAVLRRTGGEHKENEKRIVRGELELDSIERTVKVRGEDVILTAKEFDILELFAQNPGKVYTREDLLTNIWGYSSPADIRAIDVHIRHIREKTEKNAASPEYIITKWGVGYYFKP